MDFRSKYDEEGSIWFDFRSKYDEEGSIWLNYDSLKVFLEDLGLC